MSGGDTLGDTQHFYFLKKGHKNVSDYILYIDYMAKTMGTPKFTLLCDCCTSYSTPSRFKLL